MKLVVSPAVITNYHKFSDLNNTYLLSYIYRGQKFKICIAKLKLMHKQDYVSSDGSKQLPFQLLGATDTPWPFILQMHHSKLCFHPYIFSN